MDLKPITQCGKELNFAPLKEWSKAFPAICWRGQLLTGFSRHEGEALDLSESHFLDVWKACYPDLATGELARICQLLEATWPDLYRELRESLVSLYGLRWNDRMAQTFVKLNQAPRVFQNFVDQKKLSVRDFSPLLALPSVAAFRPMLYAFPDLEMSRFEVVRALELSVELFLMEKPMNDLLPSSANGGLWLRRLEQWRHPVKQESDEAWQKTVASWPWPQHVKAEWQRIGDQAGLEVKIRATSPDDFQNKLERMMTIPDNWSCKS
ncbi:MAG: hypothetical protein AB7F86_06215 [Bdellovibrionales bacterium]